jgi:hypothetical protein
MFGLEYTAREHMLGERLRAMHIQMRDWIHICENVNASYIFKTRDNYGDYNASRTPEVSIEIATHILVICNQLRRDICYKLNICGYSGMIETRGQYKRFLKRVQLSMIILVEARRELKLYGWSSSLYKYTQLNGPLSDQESESGYE